jgi:hypothetical protein
VSRKDPPTDQEKIGALVDDRLLALLETVFPLTHPVPGTQLDKVFYEAGQQSLIAYLRECQSQAKDL